MPDTHQAAEFLTRVRKRIEKHWSGDEMALDADGSPCCVGPKAVKWDIMGAVWQESLLCDQSIEVNMFDVGMRAINTVLQPQVAGETLATFDRDHTHAEVLGLLDKAIKELRK